MFHLFQTGTDLPSIGLLNCFRASCERV